MVTGLRVVFMGTPHFAVPTLSALLRSAHTVCGVITQPDRPRGRGQRASFAPVKALALDRQLPVLQPERLSDPDVERTLRGWAPDLGVVAAYGKLIPEAHLRIPPLGMINVHASLLPAWRGAAPIHRAVMAGQTTTGVTIMRVVKALDAGPMLARAPMPIGPDETSEQVEQALAMLGADLLVDVAGRLADGTALEESQDETRATYAPRLRKEEGLIDWSLAATTIHNHVRGLYPWPHAYTYADGQRLIVLTTSLTEGRTASAPGTILSVEPAGLVVATGAGTLTVEQLQPEGRRPMSGRDAVAGHRVRVGGRLSSLPTPTSSTR